MIRPLRNSLAAAFVSITMLLFFSQSLRAEAAEPVFQAGFAETDITPEIGM